MNATSIASENIAPRGGWAARKWLLLRRLSQLTIVGLFLAGPWFGLWIVKGNLNYSYTLDVLPLTDPYVLLQSLLAGHRPEAHALIGVALVTGFYFLVGGRVFCAWVCPLNAVTDLAAWLRNRLGIKGGAHLSRHTRFWLLGLTLVLAAVTGTLVWELVNPVSLLHRGLIFGFGLAWSAVLGVFLLDTFIMNRGWCGHLCPVGAFYSLLGHRSLLRVAASRREACDDCNDCFAVCPEPLVIKAPLKDGAKGIGPVILSSQCTTCGRCIDVCGREVFTFGTRFRQSVSPPANVAAATLK
jgi:ferredoxin-type protein NapH